MDPEEIPQRADRLSFVVAIMTKDYSKAISMGLSILNRDPNDHHVRKCLSALKIIHKPIKSTEEPECGLTYCETDASTSGSEESDAAGSSTEDTDNETCDKLFEAAVDADKFCPTGNSKNIADCVRESVAKSTGNTDKKLLNFREKMYRVLPLRFTRKR